MNRFVPHLALAASLAFVPLAGTSASVADAPQFTDDACPQANGPGRALNAVVPGSPDANEKIVAAAEGLVDAYRDCVTAYDRDANGHQMDQSSDYIVVHRAYARLELGRSLQRVGTMDAQLKELEKARAAYDEALKTLDQIPAVLGSAYTTGPGNEGKLLKESQDLRSQVAASESALPAGGAASPAPSPAATP